MKRLFRAKPAAHTGFGITQSFFYDISAANLVFTFVTSCVYGLLLADIVAISCGVAGNNVVFGGVGDGWGYDQVTDAQWDCDSCCGS
ncbi:MAG: hypothetical protein LBJ00_04135 [Planctomycetaceae bacterium]|nr:hypothetical protein [Planctomycetaceae bacterium]